MKIENYPVQGKIWSQGFFNLTNLVDTLLPNIYALDFKVWVLNGIKVFEQFIKVNLAWLFMKRCLKFSKDTGSQKLTVWQLC
jgi:hypothetical protein